METDSSALINDSTDVLQDSGVSVRKRVIKVMRDICVQQPTFSKIPQMCALMIKRVSDEEGIKV